MTITFPTAQTLFTGSIPAVKRSGKAPNKEQKYDED